MSRTSISWWRNVDVHKITQWSPMEIKSHCARDIATLLHCYREKHPEFILPERWPPNSPDLNPVDYSVWSIFKRRSTVRGPLMWRSWKNVCWGSGGCWTTPSSRQRLRSGIVAWVHVFMWWWTLWIEILNLQFSGVFFVYFIDNGFCKFDQKSVQSANIA